MLFVAYKVMLFQARLVQIVLFTTFENAFKIAPAIWLLMDLQMLFEVTAGCKPLCAIIALERLLASVYSLVPDQDWNLTEGLFTAGMAALVGLLLVMDSGVFLQRWVLREGLVTFLTAK